MLEKGVILPFEYYAHNSEYWLCDPFKDNFLYKDFGVEHNDQNRFPLNLNFFLLFFLIHKFHIIFLSRMPKHRIEINQF